MNIVIALVLCIVITSDVMAGSNNDACVGRLNEILSLENSSKEDKLKKWDKIYSECDNDQNQALYELGKGKIYWFHGDLPEAHKIFSHGMNIESQYKRNFILYLIDIDLANSADSMTKGKMAEFMRRYESLIQMDKNWYGGWAGVGALYLIMEDLQKAKKFLIHATNKDFIDAGPYRNLTIVLQRLNEYKESLAAFDMALKLSKSLINDKDMMIAAAYSYMYLGNYDDSGDVLRVLLDDDPSLEKDESYLKAGYTWKALIKEHGNPGGRYQVK